MSEVIPLQTPSEMRARIALLSAELEQHQLKNGGGGGTNGGMSDDWKKSVDDQLGKLHADFRLLLQWGAGAVVLIVVIIAGLYVRTDEKFEKLSDRVGAVERKVDAIDTKLDLLLERTKAVEQTKAAPETADR